jgi:hypothetical protein
MTGVFLHAQRVETDVVGVATGVSGEAGAQRHFDIRVTG